MESSRSFEDLPQEMLMEIFSYLSVEDVLFSIRNVSCRWHEVSQSPQLWRDLVYSPKQSDTKEDIVSVLKQGRNIQAVVLNGWQSRNSEVLTALINNNSHEIRRLELHTDVIYCCNIEQLKMLIQKCTKLQHLTAPHGFLSISEIAGIMRKCLTNLKSLTVNGMQFCNSPAVLKPIADGCPILQQFHLLKQSCNSSELKYLVDKKRDELCSLSMPCRSFDQNCILPVLSLCKSLKCLHIDCYECLCEGYLSLQNLTNLTSLTCSNLPEQNIFHIADLFCGLRMKQLVELHLKPSAIYKSDEDVDNLLDIIIENCPLLTKLWLQNFSAIHDDGLTNIHKLNHLNSVNLRYSSITDYGTECLSKCQNLRYVDLSYCFRVTISGILRLMTALSILQVFKLQGCTIRGLRLDLVPSLTRHLVLLDLDWCINGSLKAVRQLRAEMPHLKVSAHDWEALLAIYHPEVREPVISEEPNSCCVLL